MKKSINDINEQAQRIIRLAETSYRFKGVHGQVCKTAILKLASRAKRQHGFGLFEQADKNEKRECISPYVNRCEKCKPWWQEEKWQHHEILKVEKPKEQPLTTEQRLQLEIEMNDLCNHQMKSKVLAWIAADMTLKTNLGLPGDPFEIPQWLKGIGSHFVNMRKQKKEQKIVQLSLFD